MIKLEKENFKVDSTGWKQFTNEEGIIYLENSAGNICEFVAGVPDNLVGQQLFTWNAAMRETKKVGKRMPTDEEWDVLISEIEDKQFLGCRVNLYATDPKQFFGLGVKLVLWSSARAYNVRSEPYGVWTRTFLSDGDEFRMTRFMLDSYSVRCIKGE